MYDKVCIDLIFVNWIEWLVWSRVLLTKLPRDLFICVCFSLFILKRSFFFFIKIIEIDHQKGKVEARGARPLDLNCCIDSSCCYPGSPCWFSLNVLATFGFDISILGMFGWISWPILAERRSKEFGQEMSFWGSSSSIWNIPHVLHINTSRRANSNA